ncbi:class I glutamine amidotransferase-like protein [Laetiporus sulphureus 93-53]|uniref:Class I glutamine amidotransferase-like protein n=1 Tax=Laetiporus sulphureus 93-53 TaxID=1314785 RepID=A0A165E3D8_9APHY|nr:class I glutamine amidotransferase-like protein [Laetiporus sulphureus 93-53]KZT06168.1 class I glutamine amidotransferase-like protein [Laetiporus sulphureus 93-53]
MAQQATARILIYSATRGYRHDSIPTSIEALQAKAASINVQFDATEDQSWFTNNRLKEYDALLFLNNSGEILDEPGKAALQKYLDFGGNFIGVHCASACPYNDEFFKREVGALFDYHPDICTAVYEVAGPSHPSTSMLPARWELYDEAYNFMSDPREVGATVVLTVDESSYKDTGERKYNHGTPHPTAWFQERGAGVQAGGIAGRSFYTSLGHCIETWQNEVFLAHVLGGIQWAIQSGTTKAFNPNALVGNSAATST